jgi:hypothetical protein
MQQPMLIIHYHIFKNAGTSLDVMLRNNFGDRWAEAEFDEAKPSEYTNSARVTEFLRERPDLVTLSSHTAQLPLPQLKREILPVFFIRHPLDRLKSAYAFERVQEADTHGALLAKDHDFAGYVRHLLGDPRFRQARNFQTRRLADFEPPERGSERERALRALDSLPFVGLVEAYGRSIERLAAQLAPHFPGFKPEALHENRTDGREEDLEERVAAIRNLLPDAFFEELLQANADDFAVYETVKAKYA